MLTDINKMFQKKNFEILKNKLNLDINNNADSLNHTMSNFIDLKEIGLQKYILEMYKDMKIIYDKKKVISKITAESEKLKQIILNLILFRKENISSYLDMDIDVNLIDDTYLENYHSHIDHLTIEFNNNIELKVREEICTNFSNEITKIYNMPDEHTKDKLIEYINKSYSSTIIDKIESEALLRNTTLKNLSNEAFERFKSMNAKTVE